MKRVLYSIMLILGMSLMFCSCEKEGIGITEINENRFLEKTWVAEKTTFLLNGKESGSLDYGYLEQMGYNVKSVSFSSNGNAVVVLEDDETFVFPYTIDKNIIQIGTIWGSALTFTVIKNTNNELVVEFGEKEISDEAVFSCSPQELLRMNGVSIYHKERLEGFEWYRVYYLDNKNTPITCYKTQELTDYYDNPPLDEWSLNDYFMFMIGICKYAVNRYHLNSVLLPIVETSSARESGFTQSSEEDIFDSFNNLLQYTSRGYYFPDGDYPLYPSVFDKSNLKKHFEAYKVIPRSGIVKAYYDYEYEQYFELYKVYANKTGGSWTDGESRLTLRAK